MSSSNSFLSLRRFSRVGTTPHHPSNYDDESSSDSSDESPNARTPFYITIETKDGELENIPTTMDDSKFSIKDPIISYVENQTNPNSLSLDTAKNEHCRRPLSLVTDQELEKELCKRAAKDSRSNSIITPGLIESLKKNPSRLVSKNGTVNLNFKRAPKQRIQFVKDIFTTAVDMQWRYTLLSFATSFLVSWLVFALIWWGIAYGHGDLETENLPGGEKQESGKFVPCVWAIYDFTSCFLFSVETQHTIGYGSRSTSEECPHAIIVMCIQSIIGVVISACMAGIVFAKLARPKQRVGNLRKSHLIEAHVRAQAIFSTKTTMEGETLSYDTKELKLSCQTDCEDGDDRTLIIWPIIIVHQIDEDSPFFGMSPKDFLGSRMEIIVSLEGIIEPTGNTVQARSSYLPNEVLWGYRFENMMSYSRKRGTYVVDCSCLNAVIQDDTPRISAKELSELPEDTSFHQTQKSNITFQINDKNAQINVDVESNKSSID